MTEQEKEEREAAARPAESLLEVLSDGRVSSVQIGLS